MMTVVICLAVAMLAAGIVIAVLPSASKGNQKITINHDGKVVTVRSAGSSDISVTFDPSDLHPEEPPMELYPGQEDLAENEVTLIEEFVDPKTTVERKREIARTFNGLNCTFKLIENSPSGESSGKVVPGSVKQPIAESVEGCDEEILFPEQQDDNSLD